MMASTFFFQTVFKVSYVLVTVLLNNNVNNQNNTIKNASIPTEVMVHITLVLGIKKSNIKLRVARQKPICIATFNIQGVHK